MMRHALHVLSKYNRHFLNVMIWSSSIIRLKIGNCGLLLHLRPNYIHSTSNDIHTDGPRARARARARGYGYG